MQTAEHRIILTGASGTLGYHLLEQLAKRRDVQVLALLRNSSVIHHDYDHVQYVRINFFDSAALSETIAAFRPSCLIHCAASGVQIPRPHWFELVRFNVDVSIQLCECVSRLQRCRFVYIGTGLAYRDQGRALREDDPLDTCHPYGASKAAADLLVRAAAAEFGVALTIFRPFSFTGAGDRGLRLFPALLSAAAEGRPLALSPGNQIRDHCAADDIAAGIVSILDQHMTGPGTQIYNLGSEDRSPVRQLVKRVVQELELDVQLDFGARGYARFEPMYLVSDSSRAHAELDWQPKINPAYAIWQLATVLFPKLRVRKPRELL